MNQKTKLSLFLIGILIVFVLGVAEYYNQVRFNNMNPGLGLKELHAKGINGEGMNIAIIDQKICTEHGEYSHRIALYREMGDMVHEAFSMQGSGVVSVLAGRNCGVAPKSNILYWAVAVSGDDLPGIKYGEAIRDIMQHNSEKAPEEQVQILSISTHFTAQQGGDAFLEAVREAQDAGILVVTSGSPYYTEPPLAVYNAALRDGGDREDINDYIVQPEVVEYKGKDPQEIVQNRHLRDQQEGYYSVWVPVEPRLLASGEGEGTYTMFSTGGDSWATPFVAGVAALVLQIRPELTNEEVIETIAQSTEENENGLLMISPQQAVLKAKE